MAFDIEHFPISNTANRMINRISPIYDKSYVGKWLFQVMGQEFDSIKEFYESLRQQCFLNTCTWAISYWEEMYGITPNNSLSIEQRRAQCKIRKENKKPINPSIFEDILSELTGWNVGIDEHNEEYSFSINIRNGVTALDLFNLYEKVNKLKPSHLSYRLFVASDREVQEKVGVIMQITQHISISECNYLTDENEIQLTDENGTVLICGI